MPRDGDTLFSVSSQFESHVLIHRLIHCLMLGKLCSSPKIDVVLRDM